jgi:hypothetical protein
MRKNQEVDLQVVSDEINALSQAMKAVEPN